MARTKRQAETIAAHLSSQGARCEWLHSDREQNEREELLDDFHEGRLDALVGIGMMREGIDLPRVSLVAVLEADKGGLSRSETDLLQMIGRVTRNANGRAILYADTVNKSMQLAITATRRRRKLQEKYNESHDTTPGIVRRAV